MKFLSCIGRVKQIAGSKGALTSRTIILGFLFTPIFLGSSIYGLRWCEYALTFQPERTRPGQVWQGPNGAEDVSFLNRDNQRLYGWLVPARRQPAFATVIFFHGQAGNISNTAFIGQSLAALGFDVLLFDYRGYGRSEGEIATEKDMYADADAAFDYVVNDRGVPSERVVLYGHSLGTAAAVDLASRRICAALILESGLSSADDMATVKLRWMPKWLHALGTNRFDSVAKLAGVVCPVLVAHGERDNIVPTDQGRALFAAANEPKKLIIVPGADHSIPSYAGASYINEVAKFVRESLRGRRPA